VSRNHLSVQVRNINLDGELSPARTGSVNGVFVRGVHFQCGILPCSAVDQRLQAMSHVCGKAHNHVRNRQVVDPVDVPAAVRTVTQQNSGAVTTGTALQLLVMIAGSTGTRKRQRVLRTAPVAVVLKVDLGHGIGP
jgi:hypothetical protein